MISVFRIVTRLLISVLFLVGIFLSDRATLPAIAAVTPEGAKQVIEQSKNPQEAGATLKALDSSEIVRNHAVLDTKKDVLDRTDEQHTSVSDRRDQMIRETQTKVSKGAQKIKEKLN